MQKSRTQGDPRAITPSGNLINNRFAVISFALNIMLDNFSLINLDGKTVNVVVEHPEPVVIVTKRIFENKLTGAGNAPVILRKLND